MPDPFNTDPWGNLGSSLARRRELQQQYLPPMTPQEQESELSKIGSGALHGLGWVGSSLGKAFGGRALRGLLGGKPNELLSVIPFSDTLGITDPVNEVTGAELLGGNKDTSLFSPQGIGGLGLEIALDPSTWFGGAIVKGISKGAQLTGKGLTAIPKIGPYFGAAGEAASNLYTKTIPPLFEAAVMGRRTKVGQETARKIWGEQIGAKAKAWEEANALAEAANTVGADAPTLRNALEMSDPGAALRQVVDPVKANLAQQVLDRAAQGVPSEVMGKQNALMPNGLLEPLGYGPRQATPKQGETLKGWFNHPTPSVEEIAGRQEHNTRMLTTKINELADADMSKLSPKQMTDEIAEKYLGANAAMDADIATLQASVANGNMADLGKLTDMEAYRSSLREQAAELARRKAAGTIAEFKNDPVKDYFTSSFKHHWDMRKSEKLLDTLSDIAVPATSDPTGISLKKAMEMVGLESGANQHILDRLQKAGKAQNIVDAFEMVVPADVAKDLSGFFKATGTEGLEQFKKVWDSITNLNKAAQTILWPANHARNQGTAMWQNFVHDARYPGMEPAMGFTKPWLDAKAWKNGKPIEGLETLIPDFKGMTNAQANDALSREILKFDVMKNSAKLHNIDAGDPLLRASAQREAFLAKSDAKGFIESVTDAGWKDKEAWKQPLGVHGVLGHTNDIFPPVKAGRQFASTLDDVNRVSTYLAKRAQGLDPLEAFKTSVKAHYDFGNLTSFEKEYMRRLVPFYGWMRQNVPAVITELIEKPGGRMAQGIRVANELGGNRQGFQPEYLGEGVAAKLGAENEKGIQSYLSSTGLPFEDVGSLTSASGWLGGLNPLLKAPLELMTNRQFYTGRDLTGTVPHTGSYAGDQLMSASPIGRFATTGRMLLDQERGNALTKAVNLLTGVRTTDVDQAQARKLAIEQAAKDALAGQEGASRFERLYVRPEALSLLSPQEMALYRLYQSSRRR